MSDSGSGSIQRPWTFFPSSRALEVGVWKRTPSALCCVVMSTRARRGRRERKSHARSICRKSSPQYLQHDAFAYIHAFPWPCGWDEIPEYPPWHLDDDAA